MKKRLFTFLAVLTLAFTAVACGDKTLTTTSSTSTTSSEEKRVETPTTEDPEQRRKIDAAIETAENALKEYDFDTARQIIADAFQQVDDDGRLKEEYDRIESLMPVSLADCTVLEGAYDYISMDQINTGDTVLCMGIVCSKDIEPMDTVSRTVSYATQRKYRMFQCKLGCLNNKTKNAPMECYLQIYCDDILTKTSEIFTKGDLPVDISVEIPRCDKLDIRYVIKNPNSYCWEFSNWSSERFYSLSYTMIDPVFYPNYTRGSYDDGAGDTYQNTLGLAGVYEIKTFDDRSPETYMSITIDGDRVVYHNDEDVLGMGTTDDLVGYASTNGDRIMFSFDEKSLMDLSGKFTEDSLILGGGVIPVYHDFVFVKK